MARKRSTPLKLSKSVLREAARIFGQQGGKARLQRMTAEDRRRVARTAARARWAKEKSGRKA